MFSNINNDHIKGALVGVGVCAAGYYVYKKRQHTCNPHLIIEYLKY